MVHLPFHQINNLVIFQRLLKVLQQCCEFVPGVLGEAVTEPLHHWVVELAGKTATLELKPLAQSPLSLWSC